jgi:hypothetical protein
MVLLDALGLILFCSRIEYFSPSGNDNIKHVIDDKTIMHPLCSPLKK